MDDDCIVESVSNSPATTSRTGTPQPSNPATPKAEPEVQYASSPHFASNIQIPSVHQPPSKYGSLLNVIEDLGKDIRPTYAGNRTSAERLKRGIVHARILVRECLMECERNART